MKKVLLLVVFLLFSSLVYAENLYQQDSLELRVEVKGELELIAEGGGAKISSAKAELYLYPENSFRQKLLDWKSGGKAGEGKVVFEWKEGELGKKEYGFEALVKTENKRREINKKIAFPLSEIEGYEEYLEATETIDKDDPGIVRQATELAEGEDDLFGVVFKLADWVEQNIDYDLNTLTAGTSQKASWVLEQREGVCDEITSLFIAMARSLGIPARFVSGISYTTSELFEENWLPHGWAEVYFPGYGWVGFDITFGEYGYVDVTHIRLRDGFDPSEASTKFEWLAQQVRLEAEELKFSVEVEREGERGEEEILIRETILGEEVGLGSYNLVRGIVENKKGYYVGTTLRLGVPKEVQVRGEERKAILLRPREIKEVWWAVKVKEGLRENYWYEFPVMIYSERNISAEEKFRAVKGGIFYSEEEIEKIIVKDENKKYSREISFDCQYEKEVKLGEKKEMSCVIKNKGNVNLKGVDFCLGGVCEVIELPINQERELKIKIEGKEAGWQKKVVSAENEEVEKKELLEYVVKDEPEVGVEVKGPEKVSYGEKFSFFLKTKKNSWTIPKNLTLILSGPGFESKWEIEELKGEQELIFEMSSRGLGRRNEFRLKAYWEDEGKKFEKEEITAVEVEGKTFWEEVVIRINGIINFFSWETG